jgi:hypothetical protein
MKTLPPESLKKVQELLEQVALMDTKELSEFRYLLGKDLGLHHLNNDLKDPPHDGDATAGVQRNPKAPVLTGSAKAIIDRL